MVLALTLTSSTTYVLPPFFPFSSLDSPSFPLQMREQLRSTLQQNAAVLAGAGCLLIAVDTQKTIVFYAGAKKEELLSEAGIEAPIEGKPFALLQPSEAFMDSVDAVLAGDAVRFFPFSRSLLFAQLTFCPSYSPKVASKGSPGLVVPTAVSYVPPFIPLDLLLTLLLP